MKCDHAHIMGALLDLNEWTRIQEKSPVTVNGVNMQNLLKERYSRVVDGITYSIGVYYLHSTLTVIAYGPIGTCVAHAFINEDMSYQQFCDGCIDFEALLTNGG